MKVTFTVPGNPQGKARARRAGNSKAMYTPQKTRDYEAKVAAAYREQTDKMFTNPLDLTVKAFFRIPKSWTKKKKAEALERKVSMGKPDADNILKIVGDGLNGVAYKDDSRVWDVHCERRFSPGCEEGWIEVEITGE